MDWISDIIKVLSGAGVAGVILAWDRLVLIHRIDRYEGELRSIQDAMDRSARVDLLRLVASPHVTEEIKESASEMLVEIEGAEKERSARREAHKKLVHYKADK